MRTRFLCSVDNEAVLKALFKTKDDELSLSKAIEVAMDIEDAAMCAKETVYGEKMSNVDKIRHLRNSHSSKADTSKEKSKNSSA